MIGQEVLDILVLAASLDLHRVTWLSGVESSSVTWVIVSKTRYNIE